MVARVTRSRGAGLGARLLSPKSHVLVKAVGGTINASWAVTNTGGADGFADLFMVFLVPGSFFTSTGSVIRPGATVTLTLSGVITTLVPGTTYAAELRIRQGTPSGTPIIVAVHPFMLTIS
jgi:hypothetical protein